MNDTTNEYDLAELIGGTVGSIHEKLGVLSLLQLQQLHDLEKGAKGRTTLLDAIHGEQKRREEISRDDPSRKEESTADAPATFTREQVDALLAQRQRQHEADKELAVAEALERQSAKPAADAPVTPLAVADAVASVALTALTGMTRVVFVDMDSVPIAALPIMSFGSGDYRPNGEGAILQRDIDFPMTLQETQIAGAFMLDDAGDPVGKADLVQPYGVGGGRPARLPAGTLSFA